MYVMVLNLYRSGQYLGLIIEDCCVLTAILNVLFYFYYYGKLKFSIVSEWHTTVV